MHEIAASSADSTSQLIVAVLLVAMFVALALEKAHRVLVVLSAVAVLWGVTYLTPFHLLPLEAAARHIDLNVLLLLAAMMALVGVLKSTGVFEWGVSRLVARFGYDPARAIAVLWWFTAIASAFVDNVTTVIFVAPIALATMRRLGAPAKHVLLPLIMAANIGGTATLIGDPPNIMIGSGAGLSFMDFVKTLALPTLVMMCGLHWWGVRRLRAAMVSATPASGAALSSAGSEITDHGLLRWMGVISAGVLVGFVSHGATGMPSAVPALLGAAAALIIQDFRYVKRARPSVDERRHGILEVIEKEIEWPTLVFFALLFMVVGAAVETGLTASLANGLRSAVIAAQVEFGLSATGTLIFAGLLVMWVAASLSAVMDNIPFVAVSIPIIGSLVASLPGDSVVLWWALALGACLGGNATPIGASANVTTLGVAERDGVHISFAEFAKTGVTVTFFTIMVSSVYVVSFVLFGASRAALLFLGLSILGGAAVWAVERRASSQRV